MMELKLDLDDLEYLIGSMRLLGSKGTTGTQASFLELFDGDHEKCRRLDQRIAEKMGFFRLLSCIRTDLFQKDRQPCAQRFSRYRTECSQVLQ